jgi:hypothetical protein
MNRVAGLVLAGLVLLLNVTLAQSQDMCPIGASPGEDSVPCDFETNCFRSCCLSSGLCPDPQCIASVGSPDPGTECGSECLQELVCRPFNPDCPNNFPDEVCLGMVICLTANCAGRQAGDICLIAAPEEFTLCNSALTLIDTD